MIVDYVTIRTLWPEIILVFLASWIYLGGTLRFSRQFWALLALAGYLAALLVVVWKEGAYWAQFDVAPFLSGPMVVDRMGYFLRTVILGLGILLTLLSAGTKQRLATEMLATLMLLVVGMMLVARANDLVLVFLGLETVSIPTYVLLYLGRRRQATSEAAVKYFFLSVLSSAIMLYGFSFLYGITGTTSLIEGAFGEPSAATSEVVAPSFGAVALVFILAGLGFKLAAVPFHFYAPDVYEGVGNRGAAILAIAPKVAGIVAFVRVLIIDVPHSTELAWQLTLVLAILTMTLGNVCALWQNKLRRLLAYSSIAHAGYMLIGLSVALAPAAAGAHQSGVLAAVLYLTVYAVASLGTFAVLASLSDEESELSDVDSLSGLGSLRPWAAAVLALCMFSLAGIPPLAGFWGKLTLFSSALRASVNLEQTAAARWFMILAVVGALNAAVAAAYYLRIVAIMYFGEPTTRRHPRAAAPTLATMSLCAVLLVLIGAAPGYLFNAVRTSAAGLHPFHQAIEDQAARRNPRSDVGFRR